MSFIHSMWQDAELVDHLIESYPDYIKIKELLSERGGNREKVQTCTRITTGGTLYIVHAVMDLYRHRHLTQGIVSDVGVHTI